MRDIFIALACVACVSSGSASPPNNRLNKFIKHHEAIKIDTDFAKSQHNRFRRGMDSHFQLGFESHQRRFDMKLKVHHGLLDPAFEAIAYHGDGSNTKIHVDRSKILRGHLSGEENSSRVNMIMSEDGILEGTIAVEGEVYRLKPAKEWYGEKEEVTNVVYNTRDIDLRGGSSDHVGTCGVKDDSGKAHHYSHDDILDFETEGSHSRHRRAFDPASTDAAGNTRKACPMFLICDADFYSDAEFGNSNAQTATSKILQYLSDASAIYESTSFDYGVGTGMTLAAKTVVILTSTTSTPGSDPNGYPFNQCSNTDSGCFLDELSSIRYDGTNGVDTQYCLAHAFTTRDFDSSVLGLAYTGSGSTTGACSSFGSGQAYTNYPVRYALNTGITTTKNLGKTNVYDQTMIVFAHECGHNFGMRHDDDCGQDPAGSPSNEKTYCCDSGAAYCITGTSGTEPGGCSGTQYIGGSNGNHIMWPASVDGTMPNHNDFSFCSTNYGGSFMYTYLDNDDNCIKSIQELQGGNGVVEDSEVCDCDKSPIETALSTSGTVACPYDPSCQLTLSSGIITPSLVTGYACSPSAGVCCLDGCNAGATWNIADGTCSDTNAVPTDRTTASGLYGVLIGFTDTAAVKTFFQNVQSSRTSGGNFGSRNSYVNPGTCGVDTASLTEGSDYFSTTSSYQNMLTPNSGTAIPGKYGSGTSEILRACGAETDCTWPLMCINDATFKGSCPDPATWGSRADAFYKGNSVYSNGVPECGFTTSSCDTYSNGAVCTQSKGSDTTYLGGYTCSASVCSIFPTFYGTDSNANGMPDTLDAAGTVTSATGFPQPSAGNINSNDPAVYKQGPGEACSIAGSANVGCIINSYCHHIKTLYNLAEANDMPDQCSFDSSTGAWSAGSDGKYDPVGQDYTGTVTCTSFTSGCNPATNCIDVNPVDGVPDTIGTCSPGACINTADLTSTSSDSQLVQYVTNYAGQTTSASTNKLTQDIVSPATAGFKARCLPDNYGCTLSNGDSGVVSGCACVARADSSVTTATNLVGWVGENWWIVVLSTLGAVFMAFAVRAVDRRDPTIFSGVKNVGKGKDKKGADQDQKQLKALEDKKMNKKAHSKGQQYHHRAGRAAKQSTRITMELKDQHGLTLKEGEDPSRAHGMALRRLMRLFPTARPDTLNVVIRHTPHEDAAVRQLIRLGYGMEKISFVDPLLAPKVQAKKHLGAKAGRSSA